MTLKRRNKFYVGDPVRVRCFECEQKEIATRFISSTGLVESVVCDECKSKGMYLKLDKVLRKFGLGDIE